jgi:hypothetical protein
MKIKAYSNFQSSLKIIKNYFLKRKIYPKWYSGYLGILLFDKKILGVSIYNYHKVYQFTPIKTKQNIEIWIYFFFWSYLVVIK